MSAAEQVAAIDLALAGNRPLIWRQDNVTFRADAIEIVANGEGISAIVTAWTGNGADAAPLPVDNPVILVNPPVMVPDGGTTIEAGPDGPVTVPTARFDPLAAYEDSLAITVLQVARDLGWQ